MTSTLADTTGPEVWRYQAVNAEGHVVHGEMTASSETQVTSRLRRQNLMVMKIAPATRGGALAGEILSLLGRKKDLRLKSGEVADFTRKLATMLTAGLDLDRALRFLGETAVGPRNGRVIGSLRDRVRDGESFADALETMPAIFSKLYVGLVRAGEAGGALGDALLRLSDLLERERKLKATVQSAMIYPVVLIVASVFSIALLLTHVLPQFVPLFEENGASLPLATKIVIVAGDFLTAWGMLLLVAGLVLVACVRIALRKPAVRLATDRFLLRVPVIGTLLSEIMAAQFTRTLGTLMRNGVPLVGALRITEGVISNSAGATCLSEATRDVREGRSLAFSLERTKIFPETMTHFLKVGEETAQLAPIALRSADIHEEASRVTIQRLLAILVPAITIIMGVLVAGIVSALLLAMLSLNDLAH
ncbi:type II secretion system protein [Acetobacter aceti NRIC 0242]|uniref:Type II secretion system protein F n=1 Tax=Acetobacter aceti NBRC 14818 TaxID=887700 RepID=A0AB33ICN1_ACEAC|nr:type II secretion system F family protein [Acetobacter aceti]TCS32834.1 general secretion pathway protein F [Acetobacter aceti NBRC 14818]BCK74753.1 type II secretion system protein F [Acetobacter aceti NBRC 14818]GAN58048.1 secretion system type II protein F [Acetobacter aceti NBRC 14818]GBO80996.1 type II secretion system protein [Acetobacter aceti NRIC 0242]